MYPDMDISVIENQQSCIVIEKLHTQREEGHFCDVIFYVHGHTIKAHRNVLAACSTYFASVFRRNCTVKEKVRVRYCKNVETLKSLLNYMYTGALVINANNIKEMSALTYTFEMENILKQCENFMHDHLSSSNCFTTRDIANKCKLTKLSKYASKFIFQHIIEILGKEEVLQFTAKKLKALMCEDDFQVPQQYLMSFLCKWVEHDEDSREIYFEELLGFVNWEVMNLPCLTENLTNCRLFQNNAKCLYFVLNYLDDNHIRLPTYDEKFSILKDEFGCELQSENQLDSSEIKNNHRKKNEKNNPSSGKAAPIQSLSVKEPDTNVLAVKRPRKSANPKKISTLRRSLRKMANPDIQEMVAGSESENDSASEIPAEATYSDSETSVDETPIIRFRRSKAGLKTNEELKCIKCSFVTRNPSHLDYHINRFHSVDVTYKCSDCDFSSTWKEEYNNHLKTHYSGPPFVCKDCGYSAEKMCVFSSHLYTHRNDCPFVCPDCDKTFKFQGLLKVHMRSHTGEKPFGCGDCGRRFTAKYLLDEHMQMHRTDHPFLCDICGFSSKLKKRLSSHMQIHKGQVHCCDFPGCDFSALLHSRLRAHTRIHQNRPNVCSYCGKGFIERSYLIHHEQTHLNETPFTCELCEFATARKNKLKEHVLKHHNPNEPAKRMFKPRRKRLLRINDEEEEPETNPLPPIGRDSTEIKELPQPKNYSCTTKGSHCFQSNNEYTPQNVSFGHTSSSLLQQMSTDNHNSVVSNASSIPPYRPPPIFPQVPTISHEMPTKFRSYMSFL